MGSHRKQWELFHCCPLQILFIGVMSMKPYGIIYLITNLVNGKKYVGCTTKTILKRWRNHIKKAKYGKKLSYFHKAIRKYCPENFSREILCECESKEIMHLMETFKIIVCHSHVSDGGYNISWGGDGGDNFTNNPNKEEIRKKMRLANLGRKFPPEFGEEISKRMKGKKFTTEHKRNLGNYAKNRTEEHKKNIGFANKGKKHTEEAKRKISEKHKGKKFSDEHREKISKALAGKKKSKEHCNNMRLANIGKKLSDEHKKKISKSSLGRKHTEEAKRKISISNTGRKMTQEQIERGVLARALSRKRKG
jgi:group I intron endonuclease